MQIRQALKENEISLVEISWNCSAETTILKKFAIGLLTFRTSLLKSR